MFLKKENQELKEQNKKEFADYIKFKKEQLDEYLEKINKLIKEKQELKKQLEDANEKIILLQASEPMLNYKKALEETQQKEFIKYLEDEIQQQETVIAENQEKSYFLIYEDEKEYLKLSSQKAYIRRIILEEVLQKYKEIIGVSDENNIK